MEAVTRKRYIAQFKAQAVELVGMGKPLAEVAEEIEIGTNVLYRWVRDGGHIHRETAKKPSQNA